MVRDLQLSTCDGALVLTGRAHGYHATQLARHAVVVAATMPTRAHEIELAGGISHRRE
jgi:hypothetical protein